VPSVTRTESDLLRLDCSILSRLKTYNIRIFTNRRRRQATKCLTPVYLGQDLNSARPRPAGRPTAQRQRAAFEVMTIDVNATSKRSKVLFDVKINVQLYICENSKRSCGILAIICEIYMA